MATTWCVVYWLKDERNPPRVWGVYDDKSEAMVGLEDCWLNPNVCAVRLFENAEEE